MASMMVQQQQIEELELLLAEAHMQRCRLTVDAIERVRATLEVGLRPLYDDVRLVQEFMGSRTAQNRWGR